MENSILKSTKKVLGIEPSYTVFDTDILMHINSVFFKLNQLGIGPAAGFQIEDDTPTWDAFYGTDPRYSAVRTYMYLNVRLLFDPPTTGYHMEALKEQIREYEWRMNQYREETAWVDPDPPELPEDDELILDGGSA